MLKVAFTRLFPATAGLLPVFAQDTGAYDAIQPEIKKNKKERNIGVQTLRISKTHKVCTPVFLSFLFYIIFRKSSMF